MLVDYQVSSIQSAFVAPPAGELAELPVVESAGPLVALVASAELVAVESAELVETLKQSVLGTAD